MILQNIHHVLRALGKRPLYALVSIAVLAIAIGANTTVFGVLNAFLLRPLPYPDGDRIVAVYDSYPKQAMEIAGTAIPDYVERRAQAKSLEDLGIVAVGARTLHGEGAREQIPSRARRRRCSTCCASARHWAVCSTKPKRRSATTASPS